VLKIPVQNSDFTGKASFDGSNTFRLQKIPFVDNMEARTPHGPQTRLLMANAPVCNSLVRDPLMRLQEGTSDAVYTTSSSCSKGSRGGAMRSSVASRLLRAVSLLSLATLTWTYSPAGVSMHALLNRSHSLATLHKRACAFIPMPRKEMCSLPGCKPGTSGPWLHYLAP
jgi:hypothetical protein